jgi:hypothetical protein
VQSTHSAFFMSFISFYLSAALLVLAANEPHSFTIIDFWQRKCDEGDKAACIKMENNKLAEVKLDKLNALASEFRDSIKPEEFLLEEKPNLAKAYPLVIKSYLAAFKEPQDAAPEEFTIDYCAGHFHNYWLNKKYWWPTDIEDKPDWGTIYVYIVDHYHGICLNTSF